MTNMPKIFITIGCLLLLLAVFLRITMHPIIIAARTLRPISFVILANTSFLLAILFKK